MRAPVFVIGVAGGTASGKTTVCNKIMQDLQKRGEVALISQDSFYKSLTAEQIANVSEYNFDHPDAIDHDKLIAVVEQLKQKKEAHVPMYDFVTHSVMDETLVVQPAEVIILEGILVLAMEKVRDLCNMKIYVETDDDVRLARRIVRDVAERGRDVAGVINQYTTFVKPMFDQHVAPSRREADVIIPWSKGDNDVAIDLIVQHIRSKLSDGDLRVLFPNLKTTPSNFQVRAMQTMIRDRTVTGHDFVFYVDRLVRLVVEYALGFLQYSEREVTTPLGEKFRGVGFCHGICGVSIIRSGETMEPAVRACCMGIKIGKILITRSPGDSIRNVLYLNFPPDIKNRHVLLMDPVLASGETAAKAIETLMGHGVEESRIILITIICSDKGIRRVCTAYPKIRIVTSEIDGQETDKGILTGIGQFGDRYFGTEEEDGHRTTRFFGTEHAPVLHAPQ